MRIHSLEHAPFEPPALIAEWANERGHVLTRGLALTEEFPAAQDLDLLVILGGPMAADDDTHNPWLIAEKRFIAQYVDSGRPVLGICLGAQLLAAAVGGRVRRNPEREIGWYPLQRTPHGAADPILSAIPGGLVVGLWHGDTFDLPEGVAPAFSTDECRNQAFRVGSAVGLQFHLEWTPEALLGLVDACGDELAEAGSHSASSAELIEGARRNVAACRTALFALLDTLVSPATALKGE